MTACKLTLYVYKAYKFTDQLKLIYTLESNSYRIYSAFPSAVFNLMVTYQNVVVCLIPEKVIATF